MNPIEASKESFILFEAEVEGFFFGGAGAEHGPATQKTSDSAEPMKSGTKT